MKKVIWDHSADPQFDRREALRLRQLALSVDDDDSETLAWAAMISTYMIVDRESEIEMADRAVALNPNSFHAWHCKGWVYLEAGLQEEAIACFEHAMRVSPIDPLMYSLFTGVGVALLELHHFDEAIVTTKKGLRQNTSFAAAYRCLASAYAHLGQSAEAREAAAHVLETDPGFTISGWIARGGKTHVPLLIEGLRKAGLPE